MYSRLGHAGGADKALTQDTVAANHLGCSSSIGANITGAEMMELYLTAGSRIKQSGRPAIRVVKALPGAQGARSGPRTRPGAECTTSPAPWSAETSTVVHRRVRIPRPCFLVQLSARSGRMDRNPWRSSAVLTSSSGAGTAPTKTRYRRTCLARSRRLGGGASPGFAVGKATPGMTPPTGAGLVPGGPPCSPEWSTDAGATSTDPDDDILGLVWDALIFPLALVWDALPWYLQPLTTPDLHQGTRWELGMVSLSRGSTGIRWARVEQDKVGGGKHEWTRPHPGLYPPPSSYPGQSAPQAPTTLLAPPKVHTRVRNCGTTVRTTPLGRPSRPGTR